jgi:hypothetical protein
MNAYEASKIASEPTRNRRRAKRTRADIRTIFGSFVAMLLGCLAWHAQSLMSGTPVYEPYGSSMALWFAGIGFIAGCIDPRQPWAPYLCAYLGAYYFHLPFFPNDPLLPLGLVSGAFLAFPSYLVGLCFYAVSMFCPVDSKFGPWAGFLPSRQD